MDIPHLRRSRIIKTLTDRADSVDHAVAEEKFRKVRLAVAVTSDAASTGAGQAAVLTAVATGMKCFERAAVVLESDVDLRYPTPLGRSIGASASQLGAEVLHSMPDDVSHTVIIGRGAAHQGFAVRCWWDRWLAGALPYWDDRSYGDWTNPLAGVLAGALAIRQIFAGVLQNRSMPNRAAVASLWEPWIAPGAAAGGPTSFYMPSKLWIIGLGHLGQGLLWSMGFLPQAGVLTILQDDQIANVENEATGLLTSRGLLGERKTRIAAQWLEAKGWSTALLERRHYGDIRIRPEDPPIVITALDEPRARIEIARSGYEYMIDVGVGHGPVDFEGMQLRVLRKGDDAPALWAHASTERSVDDILRLSAYKRLADKHDQCGMFTLAQASTAVPFVGAAVGAFAMTQAIRLASMLESRRIIHVELGAPEMASSGGIIAAPEANLGGVLAELS